MSSLNLVLTPVDVDKRIALDFRAGDTIRVWQKVKEGGKTLKLKRRDRALPLGPAGHCHKKERMTEAKEQIK